MSKILIIGACGQIGIDLTRALKAYHGAEQIIAADIRPLNDVPFEIRPYVQLNVMDKIALHTIILQHKITQVYHLAAVLSATGEKNPLKGWELNMQGLLNVLDIAKTDNLKVFWPSSIAVFNKHGTPEPTTVYGISKVAGELWCKYYNDKYGVDVRSLRYPGLISHSAQPGGGTTDYAVEIFHEALKQRQYTSFLKPHTALPMMYMEDAIRATLELMEASPESLTVRTAYNIHAISFTPEQLAIEVALKIPAFKIYYKPDHRQQIADNWPAIIDDLHSRRDWGWKPQYNLETIVTDMFKNLKYQYKTNGL